MPFTRRIVRTSILAVAMVLASGASAVLSSCGGGDPASAPEQPATTSPAPTTTAAPATTTTVDPGTLPQTDERPTGSGPGFDARMTALADAITSGDAARGLPAFFPVAAYEQTKRNTDPTADWENRLLVAFRVDVADARKKLGANAATARLTGVRVPDTAVWVRPGQEYNIGPYWRVYRSQMDFSVDGRNVSIPIESMISWRGQWYVVHLGTIR